MPPLRAGDFRQFVTAFQSEFRSVRQVFRDNDTDAQQATGDGQIGFGNPLAPAGFGAGQGVGIDVNGEGRTLGNFSAENVLVMREAYVLAIARIGITGGPSEEARRAVVEIIQQLASLEPFRKAEHMAALAVEWYRSRNDGT